MSLSVKQFETKFVCLALSLSANCLIPVDSLSLFTASFVWLDTWLFLPPLQAVLLSRISGCLDIWQPEIKADVSMVIYILSAHFEVRP